jgi:hypothetical protein
MRKLECEVTSGKLPAMSPAHVKLETGEGRSKGDDIRIARVQPVRHVEFVRVVCRSFLRSAYTVL